jgi:hypothetical protein
MTPEQSAARGINRAIFLIALHAAVLMSLVMWRGCVRDAAASSKQSPAPSCVGLAPSCHIGYTAICVCANEWRASCSWMCVRSQ